jgi:hypothetical protein
MPDPSDLAAKNQRIVEAVRETFARVTELLTPDVEPATTYLPCVRQREPNKDATQDK